MTCKCFVFVEDAVFVVFLGLTLALSNTPTCESSDQDYVFNVIDYGATSNDDIDDSHAFIEAWNGACSSLVKSARVYVPPETKFLLNPITFHGPCNARRITFQISGILTAPESPSLWDGRDASQWLGFMHISGLRVDGFGGYVDGRGKAWWDQSCKYHPHMRRCTKLAPTALKFLWCNGSSVSNIKMINSAQTHILVKGSIKFRIDNVRIDSPRKSPNTDGIHVGLSRHVVISNSKIRCGDDCISLGDHTSDIQITSVECGPGHGISIGSLGKGGKHARVEKIRVVNASFNGTSNGARIKTWQVGRGYVRDIIFQNLVFNQVNNPLIIDQNYCDVKNGCAEQDTGVQISNIQYKNAVGTSSTNIAINLNCSMSVACFGISLESVYISSAEAGKQIGAYCRNAHGQESDVVPGHCLAR